MGGAPGAAFAETSPVINTPLREPCVVLSCSGHIIPPPVCSARCLHIKQEAFRARLALRFAADARLKNALETWVLQVLLYRAGVTPSAETFTPPAMNAPSARPFDARSAKKRGFPPRSRRCEARNELRMRSSRRYVSALV